MPSGHGMNNLRGRSSYVAERLGKMIIDEQAIHPYSSKLKQLELIQKTFATDVYFEQAEGLADQIEYYLRALRNAGLKAEFTTDENTFAKVKERQYDLVLQYPVLKKGFRLMSKKIVIYFIFQRRIQQNRKCSKEICRKDRRGYF